MQDYVVQEFKTRVFEESYQRITTIRKFENLKSRYFWFANQKINDGTFQTHQK